MLKEKLSWVKNNIWTMALSAVAGVVLVWPVMGWVTSTSNANTMAKDKAGAAVVEALTPLCVDKFKADANATANLAALKSTSSWDRNRMVEKGGWSIFKDAKGKDVVNDDVSRACSKALVPDS